MNIFYRERSFREKFKEFWYCQVVDSLVLVSSGHLICWTSQSTHHLSSFCQGSNPVGPESQRKCLDSIWTQSIQAFLSRLHNRVGAMYNRMDFRVRMSLARCCRMEQRWRLGGWGEKTVEVMGRRHPSRHAACDGSSQHQLDTPRKRKAQVEEWSPSDWPVVRSVEHFLLLTGGPRPRRAVPSLSRWAWPVKERYLN